jgi:hypothetical protein
MDDEIKLLGAHWNVPEIETLHNMEINLAMGSSDWTCESESCRTTFPLRPVDGPPWMPAS